MTPQMVMEAALAEMNKPFQRGVHDCCSAACLAFERLWGVPVWGLVPPYRTRGGALRLTRQYGGAEAWCDDLAARAGLIERPPHVGALGLFCGGSLPITLGLCLGDRWAAMGEGGGVTFFYDDPVRVWGV